MQIDDEELKSRYEEVLASMNSAEHKKNRHKDSGFDLFVPESYNFNHGEVKLVNYGVKCAAVRLEKDEYVVSEYPQAFCTYPRSSIYKTGFRVANCVGVIDSGYRGNLMTPLEMAALSGNGTLEKGTRLVQICMPNLEPFEVVLVDSLDDTVRGGKGFGSTGK